MTTSSGRPVWRSVLFVPGDRPDRFAKALASKADAVCLDLEDSVAPEAKDTARQAVLAMLQTTDASVTSRLMVRINPVDGDHGVDDIRALGPLAARSTLMLPKVEDAVTVADVQSALGRNTVTWPIVALIESARGLRTAHEIAVAPGVVALALGIVDLSAEMGATLDEAAMTSIRLMLKLAATEAGVSALDGPSITLEDEALLASGSGAAAALGFDGKLAIHPRQVDQINAAFSPTLEAVQAARRMVAAAADRAGAFRLDGRMVDRPVIEAAHRLLRRAGDA